MTALPLQAPAPSAQRQQTWQQQLRHSITSLQGLVEAGLMTSAQARALGQVGTTYRFALPRAYASLIDPQAGPSCPIFAQAIPAATETDRALPPWAEALSLRAYGRPAPWQADALGDLACLAAPRLTHRYGHRALLHVTSACAMYCRFCFRKTHLKAQEKPLYQGSMQPALSYLEGHPEVNEIILTGGDPFSMSDAWLARLLSQLASLPHVRTIRMHSRMATTLTARLTQGLWDALKSRGAHQQVVLVSHFNHPRELTPAAVEALRAGAAAHVMMLNQSALLRGVNDDVEVLAALLHKLYQGGIVPYYLHHPDWTPGTFAFRVTIDEGRALMAALAGRISGPALPSYVLDVPTGRGKVRLMEATVRKLSEAGAWNDDGVVQGGLWQVRLPHTRSGHDQEALYLDLAAARVDRPPLAL